VGRLVGMIAISVNQRPSVILREKLLIDDDPGLWNLILDSRILANTQKEQGGGSLSDEIERGTQNSELGMMKNGNKTATTRDSHSLDARASGCR